MTSAKCDFLCHCENRRSRAAAIQDLAKSQVIDCFASIAMTDSVTQNRILQNSFSELRQLNKIPFNDIS